jgi:hypothetical protein
LVVTRPTEASDLREFTDQQDEGRPVHTTEKEEDTEVETDQAFKVDAAAGEAPRGADLTAEAGGTRPLWLST